MWGPGIIVRSAGSRCGFGISIPTPARSGGYDFLPLSSFMGFFLN
jgi:hypothetical protein